MTLKEIIQRLEELKEKYGDDLKVYTSSGALIQEVYPVGSKKEGTMHIVIWDNWEIDEDPEIRDANEDEFTAWLLK